MRILSQFYTYLTVYLLVILSLVQSEFRNVIKDSEILWPKAIVPCYIDPNHYDHQQIFSIMASFMMFSSKTCVKFLPLTTRPEKTHQALLVENPNSKRRCYINSKTYYKVRKVTIGHDCLKSPEINTIIMKFLGIRPLDSDTNNKGLDFYNGIQNQVLRQFHFEMINLSYKNKCQLRDHQADIKVCQRVNNKQRIKETKNAIRNKRESKDNNNASTEDYNNTVNNIKVKEALAVLGIENEFDELVDKIHNMAKAAFDKARDKHCNPTLRTHIISDTNDKDDKSELFGINLLGAMAQYIMKNVSIVVNVVNFENPDPKTLNKEHYRNVEWTTIQFKSSETDI